MGGTPLGGTPLGGTPLGGTPLGGTPLRTGSRFEFGAGNRVRTGDLYLGKVPLYQLSYSRVIPLELSAPS